MFLFFILLLACAANCAPCEPPDAACSQRGGVCAPLAMSCDDGYEAVVGVPCNAKHGGYKCLCCVLKATPQAEIEETHSASPSSEESSESDDSDDDASESTRAPAHRRRRHRHRTPSDDKLGWYWELPIWPRGDSDGSMTYIGVALMFVSIFVVCLMLICFFVSIKYKIGGYNTPSSPAPASVPTPTPTSPSSRPPEERELIYDRVPPVTEPATSRYEQTRGSRALISKLMQAHDYGPTTRSSKKNS